MPLIAADSSSGRPSGTSVMLSPLRSSTPRKLSARTAATNGYARCHGLETRSTEAEALEVVGLEVRGAEVVGDLVRRDRTDTNDVIVDAEGRRAAWRKLSSYTLPTTTTFASGCSGARPGAPRPGAPGCGAGSRDRPTRRAGSGRAPARDAVSCRPPVVGIERGPHRRGCRPAARPVFRSGRGCTGPCGDP